ncbi:uncharacterized protein LOC132624027 isoform X2 [Lycium barbarum]|uniref:uncharacterized protein LOC132624027 isoform X2 n=1 Tax=Lycium barbarum TaxID=112863 RepID=UPI00293F07AB|nr:uncharacterized protein LOC132624027 isoform X2 [Lycium barbarum]
MARGRGRGSGGRVGKSSLRCDSTGRPNMPTIPIPTTVSPQQGGTSFIDIARGKGRGSPQQGGTSSIGGPDSINHVQTLGTPPVQASDHGSNPTIPELSPITPDLSGPVDEGTSNQSNTVSEEESSSRRRQRTLTLVTLTPAGLEPSKECSNTISASFKNQLDPNGINWKGVSEDTRNFYFGEFKCVEKSEINAKNRCGGKKVAAGTHTGGSICIGEHRKRLVVTKGRDPTPGEVHLHVHTHDHDGESFVDERARAVHERYQEILREKSQSQSDIDQCEAYYEAAGGTRKRRIYGLGSQAQSYYGPNLCVNFAFNASASAAPSTSQSAPTENMEELVMRLIPTLTDRLLPLFIEKARGVISSPSHHPNTPVDKPSVVTPIVPPPTTANVDDVDPLVSNGDRSPSPMH